MQGCLEKVLLGLMREGKIHGSSVGHLDRYADGGNLHGVMRYVPRFACDRLQRDLGKITCIFNGRNISSTVTKKTVCRCLEASCLPQTVFPRCCFRGREQIFVMSQPLAVQHLVAEVVMPQIEAIEEDITFPVVRVAG